MKEKKPSRSLICSLWDWLLWKGILAVKEIFFSKHVYVICLSICLSVCLSIYLSIYLSIFLSIYPFFVYKFPIRLSRTNNKKVMQKLLNLSKVYVTFSIISLHKKRSFLLRISSVNVTKSTGNCAFSRIYHLMKKSAMENFIFCAVSLNIFINNFEYTWHLVLVFLLLTLSR